MLRFLPWKFIVRRAARAYGFADPALWLARIRNFAQPSEVQEPIELVRAGMLFHARGIVNAKAIQHNLDWVWPYWVERQFDPEDISFIPRAFSLSHINLTHRNWTAVGLPWMALYPIVDPRGLVTPILDGWSVDFWLFDRSGKALVPSRLQDGAVKQQLLSGERVAVRTEARFDEMSLEQLTYVAEKSDGPTVCVDVRASCVAGGTLVVAIRPYNPEGVQFIDQISKREDGRGCCVNATHDVIIDRTADEMLTSNYENGDVVSRFIEPAGPAKSDEPTQVKCKVGMATAAAVYRFDDSSTELRVRIPLAKELALYKHQKPLDASSTWASVRSETAKLRVPDKRLQYLYDAAVTTLILLSADEVVPGPYTYRRFWFRDACLMMNAMLAIGLTRRCASMIELFPKRQLRNGYFRSQEGEWDSNGQVLWFIDRYEALTGSRVESEIVESVGRAVVWIKNKRTLGDSASLHDGLLPAGFSAEHLGPNDHYYWDDFWAEAGLRGAGRILERAGRRSDGEAARELAGEMHRAIERSIERIPPERALGGIPASPYRRMDAGAIGSLVADYPLQLFPPGSPRIMATANTLIQNYFHRGGFFQDIIHSGINAYLTLAVAQTLLRVGDGRFRELIDTIARLASPTGQWPEAIHPQTLGGCMGDGQHGWAAAEWVMMMRNCFVREESDRLIVGSGLAEDWFATDDELYFGPALTPWGAIAVRVTRPQSEPALTLEASWRGTAPRIDVAIPGFRPIENASAAAAIRLERVATASPARVDSLPHAMPGLVP